MKGLLSLNGTVVPFKNPELKADTFQFTIDSDENAAIKPGRYTCTVSGDQLTGRLNVKAPIPFSIQGPAGCFNEKVD